MQALWLCHKVLGEKSQNRRRRKRTLIEWDNFINLTDNKDYCQCSASGSFRRE